ncbi:MAG: transcriptional regulator, partial [Alphaproteobacteria bacterium]|nr:transcriptional regulator [Alphaproteobacteria bacterium]
RAGLVEAARGVGGGYRFVGNVRRLTLMDVIDLFEDISGRAEDEGDPGGTTDVGRSLHAVLAEIEDIARATLRSVTIETMLKHMERLRRRAQSGANAVNNAAAAAP